jgi:hypothetical protein
MPFLRRGSLELVKPPAKEEPAENPPTAPAGGLYLSEDLSVPFEMVTEPQGIVAQRGSGKTYLAKVLAEEFLEHHLPVLIIDILGVFWGLQSSAQGDREGYPIPIFGGDFANAPLPKPEDFVSWLLNTDNSDEGGSPRYAGARSAILDVSLISREEQRAYVATVARSIFQHSRTPLHIILDEADVFIPQKCGKAEKPALDAFEDLVRRGRIRGIGITCITQRPAVINKDILTQISNLAILRMGGPHDQKAIKEWIHSQANEALAGKVLSSLGALPIGTAWFWSPGWLGILKKVRVRRQRTFDSSSTPKLGEERKVPSVWARIDKETLP